MDMSAQSFFPTIKRIKRDHIIIMYPEGQGPCHCPQRPRPHLTPKYKPKWWLVATGPFVTDEKTGGVNAHWYINAPSLKHPDMSCMQKSWANSMTTEVWSRRLVRFWRERVVVERVVKYLSAPLFMFQSLIIARAAASRSGSPSWT